MTLDRVSLIDFSPLKALPSLHYMHFIRCSVDARDIAAISKIGMLVFSSANIHNSEALAQLSNLWHLGIYRSNIDLAIFKTSKSLTSISIQDFYADISGLASLSHLHALTIIGGNIGDLRWLSEFTALRSIDLFGVTISASAAFPKLPLLRSIIIRGSNISVKLANEIRKHYPEAQINT